MRRHLTTLLALSALTALPAAALAQAAGADTAARPIALDEAVRLAQRNSPLAVQARGQMRASRAGVTSAYAAFIPDVSVSVGSARQEGSRFDPIREEVVESSSWQYSNGISANVDLFDGGRRFFELGRARADINSAESNEVLQQYRVALDVKQQYFNTLAAREREAAAHAQLGQAQQQLRFATARVLAGAATKSDSLRSVILVGNARLALLSARNDLRVANASLTRLVQTPFVVTATLDAGLDSLTLPDSAALYALAERGPAVEQAEAQVAAARAALRAARTPYLPSLRVSYSRGGSAFDTVFHLVPDVYQYNNVWRFTLSYPIFNQFTREEQRVRADVALDNAEAQVRDARLRAQQELTQALGALQTAEQRIEIQRASVAAAEEDLRVQQQRYALGAATLLDVLTSQTQLDQARAALIQARYDFRVAGAQIEALIGRDL